MAPLTGDEVAKHNTAASCWVIIHEQVYNVTDFLPEHPGGQAVILRHAGGDGTAAFDPVHPPDVLEKYLPQACHLGPVDMATVQSGRVNEAEAAEERARQARLAAMPPLSQCFNLLDFEAVARRVMTKGALAYYSSGADDEITLRENHAAFHRIWFRPRVLVDVSTVSLATTMLGTPVAMPFYVTATALGRLGHPDGETVLTRAARAHGVVQMIPTLASCSFDEIADAAGPGQPQWLQLYVSRDRDATRRAIEHAELRGCAGLFVTVDAPQLGRRERDMRLKFEDHRDCGANVQQAPDGRGPDTSQGAARAISGFIDPSVSWDDIGWIRAATAMPVVLKGVQRVEDVLRAVEAGVQAVVLSNHGGRQLDFARSGIEILAEVMPVLRARGLASRIEVYVDGGVRRGTDILKALCLGARGVGIGRPFLWAMSAYGADGVSRAMGLLRDELEMDMRLLGARCVAELGPDLVDARGVAAHGNGTPRDALSEGAYERLAAPGQKARL